MSNSKAILADNKRKDKAEHVESWHTIVKLNKNENILNVLG